MLNAVNNKKLMDFKEKDNWNFAREYSQLLFEHLKNLYKYEKICRFGIFNFEDQFEIDKNLIDNVRLKGLEWYGAELEMLIRNVLFAIIKKEDREKLSKYKEEIIKIQELIPFAKEVKINHRDNIQVIKIKEEIFKNLLKMLIQLKEEILFPLNASNLIFTNIEIFDPDKFKKEVAEDLIFGG